MQSLCKVFANGLRTNPNNLQSEKVASAMKKALPLPANSKPCRRRTPSLTSTHKTIMKTTKNLILALVAAIMTLSPTIRAAEPSDNPNIYGTWVLESMQYEGEKLIECRKNGYTQIKYYGKDGEYACLEFNTVNTQNSIARIVVRPHEYGKPGEGYWYRDGQYCEMGREPVPANPAHVIVDKNTVHGQWMNRHDVWKRIELPKKLLDDLLTFAKGSQAVKGPADQEAMHNLLMKEVTDIRIKLVQ